MEERFITGGVNDVFVLRSRYLLTVRVPLRLTSNERNWFASLRNEIGLNINKNEVFDRDRLGFGIGNRLSKKSTIEFTWINQFDPSKTIYFAQVVFRNQFDWRKSTKVQPTKN